MYVPLFFCCLLPLALASLKRTYSECYDFPMIITNLCRFRQILLGSFNSVLFHLSYHSLFLFPPWFMPLWFKETNLTQPWVRGENKWVTFFRLPGDRKEDGRKLLEKCNHYCNRPAVLWISHNYLTIWVNAGMLSLPCQHVRVHIKKTHRAAATRTISSSLCACTLITVSLPLASHYPSQTSKVWVAVVFICMHACLNAPVQCWGSNPGP